VGVSVSMGVVRFTLCPEDGGVRCEGLIWEMGDLGQLNSKSWVETERSRDTKAKQVSVVSSFL
jgi:hypothetical protein